MTDANRQSGEKEERIIEIEIERLRPYCLYNPARHRRNREVTEYPNYHKYDVNAIGRVD